MIIKKTLTPTEGKLLVTEFHKSGLKPGQFCKQKNISYYTLQYWRDKYSTKNNSLAQNESQFLPINLVQPKSNSNFIKITLNSKITIELANDLDLLKFKKILEICSLCG